MSTGWEGLAAQALTGLARGLGSHRVTAPPSVNEFRWSGFTPARTVNRAHAPGCGSNGTVTALAAAGGSTQWGFGPEPRVKAILGMAIGAPAITFGADVKDVSVPALLVAGALDRTSPQAVSEAAFEEVSSDEKAFVSIPNATHRSLRRGPGAELSGPTYAGKRHLSARRRGAQATATPGGERANGARKARVARTVAALALCAHRPQHARAVRCPTGKDQGCDPKAVGGHPATDRGHGTSIRA
jgi:predicted dienelactone hydrolase